MVHIIDHPLIKHKLTLMRMKETDSKNFKDYLDEIAGLMAYEITRDLPLKNINIETPVAKCVGYELDKKICLVPILRAGLGMVDGIKKAIPSAKVGHIGLYRDEDSLQPVQYFAKFPVDMKDSIVFVVDPMLATGGSACEAIKVIKSKGVKNIKLICLVGVDEGINYVTSHYPDVEIYLACKDEKLNENGYIVPGLGDAGDRIFGTK